MNPPAHDRGVRVKSFAVPTKAYVSSGRLLKLHTHTLRSRGKAINKTFQNRAPCSCVNPTCSFLPYLFAQTWLSCIRYSYQCIFFSNNAYSYQITLTLALPPSSGKKKRNNKNNGILSISFWGALFFLMTQENSMYSNTNLAINATMPNAPKEQSTRFYKPLESYVRSTITPTWQQIHFDPAEPRQQSHPENKWRLLCYATEGK